MDFEKKDLIEETINFKEQIKYDFEIEIDREFDISRKENIVAEISEGILSIKIPSYPDDE